MAGASIEVVKMSADDEDDALHLELHRAADELGKFAARLKIRKPKGMSPSTAKEFMDALLVSVTKECFADGADLIGHVKAFMHTETGTLMASLVDLDVGVQLTSGLEEKTFKEAEVTLHVIVHGIWDDKVKEASRRGIQKTIKKFNLDLEVLQDYFETEKSIQHHVKK
jgi:hypothetical protein